MARPCWKTGRTRAKRRASPPETVTPLVGRIQADAAISDDLSRAQSGFPLWGFPVRACCSGLFLGLQDLAALVHAGLEVEVVRTAQFARILVLSVGRLLQGVRRAAHATPRGRCFSSGNGHNGPLGMLSEGIVRSRKAQRVARTAMPIRPRL